MLTSGFRRYCLHVGVVVYFYQGILKCNKGSSVSRTRHTGFLNDSCKHIYCFWEELLVPRNFSLWRNRLARSAVNRKVNGSNASRDVPLPFGNPNYFWNLKSLYQVKRLGTTEAHFQRFSRFSRKDFHIFTLRSTKEEGPFSSLDSALYNL